MHIILVSNRLATAKSLTLSARHLLAAGIAVTLVVFALAISLAYFSFRHAAEVKLPLLQSVVLAVQAQEKAKEQSFVR